MGKIRKGMQKYKKKNVCTIIFEYIIDYGKCRRDMHKYFLKIKNLFHLVPRRP